MLRNAEELLDELFPDTLDVKSSELLEEWPELDEFSDELELFDELEELSDELELSPELDDVVNEITVDELDSADELDETFSSRTCSNVMVSVPSPLSTTAVIWPT